MTRDPDVLRHWLLAVLWVAAIFCTLFPVLYSFSRWWQYLLGRILMLATVGWALAVDVTLLFAYWQPKDILIYFWTQLVVFSLIALGSAAMSFKLFVLNYGKRNTLGKEPK